MAEAEETRMMNINLQHPFFVVQYGVINSGNTCSIIIDPTKDEDLDAMVVLEFKPDEPLKMKATQILKKDLGEGNEESKEAKSMRKAPFVDKKEQEKKYQLMYVNGKIEFKVLNKIVDLGAELFEQKAEDLFIAMEEGEERLTFEL